MNTTETTLSNEIGQLVILSLDATETDRATMRQLFQTHGIDEKYLPELPAASTTLSAAIRAHTGKKFETVRPIEKSKAGQVYAVMDETVKPEDATSPTYDGHAQDRLEANQIDKIILEINGQCRQLAYSDTARLIVADYHRRRDLLLSQTVLGMAKSILDDSRAVSIRPNGGVYFCSPPSPTVAGIVDLLNAIPHSRNSCSCVEIQRAQTDQIVPAINRGLENELSALFAELAEFAEKKSTDKNAIRSNSISTRIEKFTDLRKKAELYETVLSVSLETLKTRCDQAKKHLASDLKIPMDRCAPKPPQTQQEAHETTRPTPYDALPLDEQDDPWTMTAAAPTVQPAFTF